MATTPGFLDGLRITSHMVESSGPPRRGRVTFAPEAAAAAAERFRQGAVLKDTIDDGAPIRLVDQVINEPECFTWADADLAPLTAGTDPA
jgi:hypothetical protein